MNILITGSMGFVGTETLQLLEKEHFVVGYDLMNGADIRDIGQLERVFESFKPQRVLHLAAIARFADADKDPKLAFETNVIGTKNVVDTCKKYHVPLVYASTGSVYMPMSGESRPPVTEDWPAKGNSVYGCTKYMGELYVREHTPHIILRYAHLYGKEKRMHGLIGGFIDRINRGLEPTLYGGKQSNDFTYIKDIANANKLALEVPWDKWNQVYNIGTGEELTAEQAGNLICEFADYKGKIDIKPQREVDASRFVYDISKAKAMLKYEPQFNFAKGLEDMFK